MSVAVADITEDVDVLLAATETPAGVVRITAGLARSLGLKVCLDESGDSYQGHAFVVGKKTKSIKRKLAQSAEWVALPPAATRQGG